MTSALKVAAAPVAAPALNETQIAVRFVKSVTAVKASDFRKYTVSTDGTDVVKGSWRFTLNPFAKPVTIAQLSTLAVKNLKVLNDETATATITAKFREICKTENMRKPFDVLTVVSNFEAALKAQAPVAVETKPVVKTAAPAEAKPAAVEVAAPAAPAEKATRTSPRLTTVKA